MPIVHTRSCSSAAWATPAAICEKYGSAMLATSNATVADVPRAVAWAERFAE